MCVCCRFGLVPMNAFILRSCVSVQYTENDTNIPNNLPISRYRCRLSFVVGYRLSLVDVIVVVVIVSIIQKKESSSRVDFVRRIRTLSAIRCLISPIHSTITQKEQFFTFNIQLPAVIPSYRTPVREEKKTVHVICVDVRVCIKQNFTSEIFAV